MKDRIARACAELLRTRCVDEITVRDIAEACGISRQAFYYYFENIESVAAYSVDKALEQLRETCMREEDPKEVLRIIIRNYRSQYSQLKHLMQSRLQPNIMRYYYEVLFSSDASGAPVREGKALGEASETCRRVLDLSFQILSDLDRRTLHL